MKLLKITPIMAVFFCGCRDDSERFYSPDAGGQLVSKPGIRSESVTKVHMYRINGQIHPLANIPEMAKHANKTRIIDDASKASDLVRGIQNASAGKNISMPKTYKMASSWHVLIYFDDEHIRPAYWIIRTGNSPDGVFLVLMYNVDLGSMRVFPGIGLNDDGALSNREGQ